MPLDLPVAAEICVSLKEAGGQSLQRLVKVTFARTDLSQIDDGAQGIAIYCDGECVGNCILELHPGIER
jgi:hypothetical protein